MLFKHSITLYARERIERNNIIFSLQPKKKTTNKQETQQFFMTIFENMCAAGRE